MEKAQKRAHSQQGEDQSGCSITEEPPIPTVEEDPEALLMCTPNYREKKLDDSEEIHLPSSNGSGNTQANLKHAFEKEYKKRKKEFKKRYDYYIKIKKGIKVLNLKVADKSRKLNELCSKNSLSKSKKDKVKLEIEKDNYKYTICIIKEDKTPESEVSYKMYKQKTQCAEERDLSLNSAKTLELVTTIENCKDKLKRLKALKVKNDEKLLRAKKGVEALKTKNGVELMEELNLVPKKQKDTIKELLDKKRDMAIKGSFKMPKIRNLPSRSKKCNNFINNISTVEEEDDDEDTKSNDYLGLTRDALKKFASKSKTPREKTNLVASARNIEEQKLTCTAGTDEPGQAKISIDNLNKMNLKNDRSTFHGSLVGSMLNSFKKTNNVAQSTINFGNAGLTCGKMFMMSQRSSFIGTQSMIGQSFSTIGSLLSSMNDGQSQLISDFDTSAVVMDEGPDFSHLPEKE